MTTTNFPDGVTNASYDGFDGQMTFPDPTLFHTYFNDFDTYVAADWVITETGAGGTQTLSGGNGGFLLLTSDVLDNDGMVLQKTPSGFAFTANKKCWFACKFALSDVVQSDLQLGLVIVDTTPLDATDGIYFQKDDGAATVDVYVRKNATTGSNKATAVATLVAATQTVLQWYYDGAGRLYYGIDGRVIGSMDASSTYLPDSNVTISMAFFNGEAGAETLTIDYILAAMER